MGQLNSRNLIYKEQLDELSSTLYKSNISEPLTNKAIEYYEFTWKKTNIFRSINDFSNLSESL
jgi:hypothetical protein